MKHRSLHHYSEIDSYQFITFRTQDSIDGFLLKLADSSDFSIAEKQMQIDEYSDRSNKGCYLNKGFIALLMTHIKALDPVFYRLIAVSIMPNHVHLLVQQTEEMKVIMKKLKGVTAFEINKLLVRKGHLWEKSYFDKAIRDESHFQLAYNYIKNNAIKANLKDADIRFYGIYE